MIKTTKYALLVVKLFFFIGILQRIQEIKLLFKERIAQKAFCV
jgi:hypothetical protein